MNSVNSIHIRPLQPDDLPAVADFSASAFGNQLSDEPARQRWLERLAHPMRTDPAGAFLAERDGQPLGVAEAIRRERLWVLSMLAVDPTAQSAGTGRALLERALGYGADCDAGLICSSSDPRAMRLYGLTGFSLHPTFAARGQLDRRRLPAADAAVREVDGTALEELASISRAVRGGPHTTELAYALDRGFRLLRHGERGFAAIIPGSAVWLLAARDPVAAQALLWSALDLLGEVDGERPLARWITAGQDWAIDVLLRAGYALEPYGALCVRGRPGSLQPFLPSPPFA